MKSGALETYLIPVCSWYQGQRRPGDGFKIRLAVVEEFAIKS